MAFDKLCILIGSASPTTTLITQCAALRQLLGAGLMRQRRKQGGWTITPSGLRALADQMDAGYVDDAMDRLKREHQAPKERQSA